MPLTPEQRKKAEEYFHKSSSPTMTVGDYLNSNRQKAEVTDSLVSRLKTRATDRLGNLKDNASRTLLGQQTAQEGKLQAAGQVAGFLNDVTGEAIQAAGSALPESIKNPVKKVGIEILETPAGKAGLNALKQGQEMYRAWKEKNPTQAADLEAVVNIASVLPMGKGAQVGANVAKEIGEGITKSVEENIVKKVPQYGEKAVKWLASEPDEQVKTILKETPKAKFDEYLKIAEDASTDPRKTSVFEKVGERLADATKQLKKQSSSLGAQKSAIIEKANVGLQEFKDAPRKAVLEVAKLEDNPLKKKVLDKLKSVKTKLDADKAIDDIQSMVYDAKGTNLIAEGSTFEKQLKSIVGEMNEALKNSLPESYRTLNDKFAERARVLGTLNRALGEVVEGVPTRGASLIKQFFSPSASKSKELFEFVKKNTGVDLAQDATVAKFMGELFDDPKVRSLLEGIPTSKQGILGKILDVATEKSDVGKRIQKRIKKIKIEKARDLTK